jgi:small subunit ribosomal protein S16
MPRMLTIRLQRVGRKNDPSFRVVVVESKRGPKSGSYLEVVGSYDARTNRTDLQGEKIKEWIGKGVQVSDTVHNLLITKGIVEGKKRNVLPKKTVAKPAPVEPSVKEEAAAPAPETAPAEVAPAPVEEIPETPAEVPASEEAPAA